MFNYLQAKLPLLRLLTAIFFLLIYVNGEKIGAFMFMILLMYPFLIMDGAGNILSLDLNKTYLIPIDIIVIALLYWSVIYLIRSRKKHTQERKSINYSVISMLVMYLFCLKMINWEGISDTFSKVTIGVFVIVSSMTIFISIKSLFTIRDRK